LSPPVHQLLFIVFNPDAHRHILPHLEDVRDRGPRFERRVVEVVAHTLSPSSMIVDAAEIELALLLESLHLHDLNLGIRLGGSFVWLGGWRRPVACSTKLKVEAVSLISNERREGQDCDNAAPLIPNG
jgi:hypothetical protein